MLVCFSVVDKLTLIDEILVMEFALNMFLLFSLLCSSWFVLAVMFVGV